MNLQPTEGHPAIPRWADSFLQGAIIMRRGTRVIVDKPSSYFHRMHGCIVVVDADGKVKQLDGFADDTWFLVKLDGGKELPTKVKKAHPVLGKLGISVSVEIVPALGKTETGEMWFAEYELELENPPKTPKRYQGTHRRMANDNQMRVRKMA